MRGRLAMMAAATTLIFMSLGASALAAEDVNSQACSPETTASPGFRAFMPDCRAYELVTPPYTAGQAAIGSAGSPPMTFSGERLIGVDYADFAGTENEEGGLDELGVFYKFARTPAGWSAESLDPPASQYPRRRFDFPSADLSRSLWEVYLPEHEGEESFGAFGAIDSFDIALREETGSGKGRFVLVGSKAAPGHEPSGDWAYVVGASAELTHVFVSVGAEGRQLWPGDSTVEGGRSLYEYVGTDEREPVLVGVKNEGAPPWEVGAQSANDGAQLESKCGTSLAGNSAVSAEGEVVYFMASECAGGPPVEELYVRVNGERTLDISEPPLSLPGRVCSGVCETAETDEHDRAPAAFQGASADGTKVFFTTEQPLVNEAAPGENDLYEETISKGGSSAHATSLTLIARNVPGASVISQDGTRVYFQATDVLSARPNANGEEADPGAQNLYVYDTVDGTKAFVAREPDGEFDTTSDGQFLAFGSERDLEGTNDSSTVRQLFEYDAETEALVRVSSGQRSTEAYECPATHTVEAGFNCDGNTSSYAPTMVEPAAFGPAQATSGLSVSKGGIVVFVSGDRLTPYAVSGGENIYEYRAGNVYLISPGDEAAQIPCSGCRSRLIGIDETGDDVFFWSADRLVPQDTDTQAVWYDAREQGGFPAPPSQIACSPDACEEPLSSPLPRFSPQDSEVTPGGGNLISPAARPVSGPKPLSREQELAKALKACKHKHKSERAVCEKRAKKRYGTERKKGKG